MARSTSGSVGRAGSSGFRKQVSTSLSLSLSLPLSRSLSRSLALSLALSLERGRVDSAGRSLSLYPFLLLYLPVSPSLSLYFCLSLCLSLPLSPSPSIFLSGELEWFSPAVVPSAPPSRVTCDGKPNPETMVAMTGGGEEAAYGVRRRAERTHPNSNSEF